MTLYCINQEGKREKIISLLGKAARKRGLKFVVIDQNKFNYTRKINAKPGDLLYRVSVARKAANVEKYLTLQNDFVTFRTNKLGIFSRFDNVFEASLIHQYYGLPIIKTVFGFTKDRQILSDYIKYLGGFPIILKATGGRCGIGVMRVDSQESLQSVVDMLDGGNRTYIMRKYLKNCRHGRFVVLGGKVISSIENKIEKDDFRTGGTRVVSKKFSAEVESIAVKAVDVLNLEFGGVDILFDKNNKPFIAEVNFPFYFPSAQETHGADVAGQMVDFLIAKSQKGELTT